jgi:hypothetical protein
MIGFSSFHALATAVHMLVSSGRVAHVFSATNSVAGGGDGAKSKG